MSAGFGRLQAALAAATSDVTVAAANLNFDFTLVKVEAPKEFHPLGESLTLHRRNQAEYGSSHIVARRLGALFDGICPATPNLLKAYGKRASEISEAANAQVPKDYASSIFASYQGIDCTNIWAAATSSTVALHVHLLSCILARMLKPPEATAAWVELVKERRRDIVTRLEEGEAVSFSLASAANQADIPRDQLADWDAGARAWLRAADATKQVQQKKLDLILKNIHLDIKPEQSTFSSIIAAWKAALQTMERLVSGMPQAVQDGNALLGLSAWHIYPDMTVLGSKPLEVHMNDSFVSSGGVLSLGLHDGFRTDQPGIYWSLSLAHLRHYGYPVKITSELRADPVNVSFTELMQVVLGAILGYWGIGGDEINRAMRFFVALSGCLIRSDHRKLTDHNWINRHALQVIELLASAASTWLSAEGEEKDRLRKLIMLGERRNASFLKFHAIERPGSVYSYGSDEYYEPDEDEDEDEDEDTAQKQPFFGLLNQKVMKAIQKAKGGAFTCKPDADFASDNHQLDHQVDPINISSGSGISATTEQFDYLWGFPGATTISASDHPSEKLHSNRAPEPKITVEGLVWLLDSGMLSEKWLLEQIAEGQSVVSQTLLTLTIVNRVYKLIPEAKINIGILDRPLLDTKWAVDLWRQRSGGFSSPIFAFEDNLRDPRLTTAFSIIAYLESGVCDVSPRDLDEVVAISYADALYVDMRLLCDPWENPHPYEVKRILGNIGKAGITMLASPTKPMTRKLDPSSWRIANYRQFDGTAGDYFQGTSLHLSFTEYNVPLYTGERGLHETQAHMMEAVISVHDQGKWVTDLDIAGAFRMNVFRTAPQPPCEHRKDIASPLQMTSIECWDELLDPPVGRFVVRAHKNWIARLAITAFLVQKQKLSGALIPVAVCENSICWECMQQYYRTCAFVH